MRLAGTLQVCCFLPSGLLCTSVLSWGAGGSDISHLWQLSDAYQTEYTQLQRGRSFICTQTAPMLKEASKRSRTICVPNVPNVVSTKGQYLHFSLSRSQQIFHALAQAIVIASLVPSQASFVIKKSYRDLSIPLAMAEDWSRRGKDGNCQDGDRAKGDGDRVDENYAYASEGATGVNYEYGDSEKGHHRRGELNSWGSYYGKHSEKRQRDAGGDSDSKKT